jgi:hypothetical protein
VDLAEEFEFFARSQCEGRSPTYARLSRAVAADPALLELVNAAPPDQRRPSLFFAAIQYLLLRGAASGDIVGNIAAWYPSVSGRAVPAGDPVPALRRFCREHAAALLGILANGRTQTNEVRRCAALLLALDQVTGGRPFGLLELGASAGLNLCYDRYSYQLGALSIGVDDSPVHIAPAFPMGAPPVGPMPIASWRLGADLSPVDIRDGAAADWLRAFIWPEQATERDRLDAAIALARVDPPPLTVADAVRDLAGLLARAPDDRLLCVFHATLLTYVDRQRADGLFAGLRAAMGRRPLAWIYLEAAGLLRGEHAPAGVTDEHRADRDTYVLGMVTATRDAVLARVATYGETIRWLA